MEDIFANRRKIIDGNIAKAEEIRLRVSEIEKLIEESSNWNYDKMSLKQSQRRIKYLMNGILRKWYLTIENDTVMMTLYGYLTKSKTTKELKSILEFPSVSTEQINFLCIHFPFSTLSN